MGGNGEKLDAILVDPLTSYNRFAADQPTLGSLFLKCPGFTWNSDNLQGPQPSVILGPNPYGPTLGPKTGFP